jgi:hypothetical protein
MGLSPIPVSAREPIHMKVEVVGIIGARVMIIPGLLGSGLATFNMFDHNINFISVLHVEIPGSLALVEAVSFEEEANVAGGELCEKGYKFCRLCVHKLLELNATIDLEGDLLSVLRRGIIIWLLALRLRRSQVATVLGGITHFSKGLYQILSSIYKVIQKMAIYQ